MGQNTRTARELNKIVNKDEHNRSITSKIYKSIFKEQKKSVPALVKELDKIFSTYIRLREADENGIVKCFTSGKFMDWKQAHAGHFISRRHYATRWDEQNVQVQSVSENMFNQGNAPKFAINLDLKYGKGTAEKLSMKKNNSFKLHRFILENLIEEYKIKVEKLNK